MPLTRMPDACPPGVVDSFEDGVWPEREDAPVPATITNEEVYGWLVTAAYPVMLNGKAFAHICVDISMNDIRAKEQSYVTHTSHTKKWDKRCKINALVA